MPAKCLINNSSSKGFTLIEIMIVVAIMVAVTTASLYGMGIIGRADVKGEAIRFSSDIRYVFNMAASSNKTLQMKIDFDSNQFTVEELSLTGALSEKELMGKSEDNKRRSKIDEEDETFGKVQRTKLDDDIITEEESSLKDGVYFLGLLTSHHDALQTEDIGTINFFANGFVERSVIYLGDEIAAEAARDNNLDSVEGSVIYTITVSPLTGIATVSPGYVEHASSFFEEEEDD